MGMDTKELRVFQKRLERLREKDLDEFYRRCARKLAETLLGLVIPMTPVGKSTYGMVKTADGKEKEQIVKNGGTLRRGWITKTEAEAAGGNGSPDMAAIRNWVDAITIIKSGNSYKIEVTNPVKYASYVEYGHEQTPGRYVPAIGKRLVNAWVPGQFMLNISEEKLVELSPQILEAEFEKLLKEAFDG